VYNTVKSLQETNPLGPIQIIRRILRQTPHRPRNAVLAELPQKERAPGLHHQKPRARHGGHPRSHRRMGAAGSGHEPPLWRRDARRGGGADHSCGLRLRHGRNLQWYGGGRGTKHPFRASAGCQGDAHRPYHGAHRGQNHRAQAVSTLPRKLAVYL
jgi:hypothetical protein